MVVEMMMKKIVEIVIMIEVMGVIVKMMIEEMI